MQWFQFVLTIQIQTNLNFHKTITLLKTHPALLLNKTKTRLSVRLDLTIHDAKEPKTNLRLPILPYPRWLNLIPKININN